MGSDKKRKRREADVADDNSVDSVLLSEKKKAKKAAKAAAKAALAESPDSGFETPKKVSDTIVDVADTPPLLSPIASPMAGKKLMRHAFALVEEAAKAKALRRGIKEVVLALRKGDKGVCFLAGDVFPVEVIAHLPLLCEESGIPYCYVSRKTELGVAALTKRPTSVVLVSEKGASKDLSKSIKGCRKELAEIQSVY